MIEKNPLLRLQTVNTQDSLDKGRCVATLDKLLIDLKKFLFFSVADAKERAVHVQQMHILHKRMPSREERDATVSSPTEYTPLLGINNNP